MWPRIAVDFYDFMIHDLCFMIFLVLCAAVIPGGGGGGGGPSGPFGGGGGGGGGPCGLPERNLKSIASHVSLYIHIIYVYHLLSN